MYHFERRTAGFPLQEDPQFLYRKQLIFGFRKHSELALFIEAYRYPFGINCVIEIFIDLKAGGILSCNFTRCHKTDTAAACILPCGIALLADCCKNIRLKRCAVVKEINSVKHFPTRALTVRVLRQSDLYKHLFSRRPISKRFRPGLRAMYLNRFL